MGIYAPGNWKATGSNGVDKLAVGDVPIGVSSCAASCLYSFWVFLSVFLRGCMQC